MGEMMEMMEWMDQKHTKSGQIFPSPRNGETVYETPPCLSWMKCQGCNEYTVKLYQNGKSIFHSTTDKNYLVTPLLEAGEYEWDVVSGSKHRGKWSFSISPEAVTFLRPTSKEVLEGIPPCHPRMMFTKEDIPQIIESRQGEIETLRCNIKLALSRTGVTPPRFHRDRTALPYREYFGSFREWCDRDMIACAIGYALLGDLEAGRHGKELLLTFCDWNPEGPCSVEGEWGDEIGLSMARCLPAAYDMLYGLLDERQRRYVEKAICAYALQCKSRLERIDYCQNPGDSHVGRLPAYLGEAAMVLHGSGYPQELLSQWLDLALDIYGGIFPYYGDQDGGWAEGTFYSTSYTKWYLSFFLSVERFTGKAFLSRPFYQNYIHFLLHFAPPGLENHPFCDGYWCTADDVEWPGFFAQNPYRVYAQRFRPKDAEGRKLALEWEKEMSCPDIFKLHLLDIFVPDIKPGYKHMADEVGNMRVFRDSGFVSIHSDLKDRESDMALYIHATGFGSGSHRHADQGSFAVFKGGVSLISPSGYFGFEYGTKHHLEWTNTTMAHNCILVDGVGQKTFSHEDVGRILAAGQLGPDHYKVILGLETAYPMLEKYERSFEIEGNILTVRDHIESSSQVTITWLLHSLSEPQVKENTVSITRKGVRLTVSPCRGGLDQFHSTDQFAVGLNEGVAQENHVVMPKQYHLSWTTEPARVHDIEVRFVIGSV